MMENKFSTTLRSEKLDHANLQTANRCLGIEYISVSEYTVHKTNPQKLGSVLGAGGRFTLDILLEVRVSTSK